MVLFVGAVLYQLRLSESQVQQAEAQEKECRLLLRCQLKNPNITDFPAVFPNLRNSLVRNICLFQTI